MRTPLIAVIAAALTPLAPAARAQTFSNPAAITVPTSGADGRATPYPSSIVVTGAPASIQYVSVTLRGVSHSFFVDLNVLLLSPTGQKILLLANTNAFGSASNATLTFIPDGASTLPESLANVESGVYACSVYNAPGALPSPAPAGPYGTSLAPLTGTNANGTWSLYVTDTAPFADNGTFANGWSITFNDTPVQPMPRAITYQGRLAVGATPVTGDANVRFTLCDSAAAPLALTAVAPDTTRSFTGISAGLVSTPLDFGPVIDTPQALWLNIEVESPPGSGFVTLSPRQPITPAPQARVARSAQIAAAVPWSGVTGVPANVSGAFSPFGADASGGINTTQRVTLGASGVGAGFGLPKLFVDGTSVFFGSVDIGVPIPSPSEFQVGGSADIAGSLVVGSNSLAPAFRLTVAGDAGKPGGGQWATLSDPRAKHDIAPMHGTLDKLLTLRGYTFEYNADRVATGLALPGPQIGLMADEVANVFPDWVSTDAVGTRYVTERATTALMVEALRDLRAEKDATIRQQQERFDAELAKRDAENAELKDRLAAIEAAITRMNAGR